jgi:hypothetical protein
VVVVTPGKLRKLRFLKGGQELLTVGQGDLQIWRLLPNGSVRLQLIFINK